MKTGKFGRRVHASPLATPFPVNFIRHAEADDRQRAERIWAGCAYGDIGSMTTKGIAPGSWGEKPSKSTTCYEPFASREWIQKSVNLSLSPPMIGICTATDIKLLPGGLQAGEKFTQFSPFSPMGLVYRASEFKPLFT